MTKKSLTSLVKNGLSTRKIAECTGKSQTTICYWLKKYELKTTSQQCNVKDFHCKYCGETNPDLFVNMNQKRRHKTVCKKCHSKNTVDRFNKYKQEAINYKGGKCKKCGYDRCIGALEFHHRNPQEKDPSWKYMRNRKFENIKKELDKCDLLCANCHRELHCD